VIRKRRRIKEKYKAVRTTTKFKKVLTENNVEIRMDDAGKFQVYLFNKKDKTVCVLEGKNWGDVITKSLTITKKYGNQE